MTTGRSLRTDPVGRLLPLLQRLALQASDAAVMGEIEAELERIRVRNDETENALDDLVQLHLSVSASLVAAEEEAALLPLPVLSCDAQLILRASNPAGQEFLGATYAERGRDLRHVITARDLPLLLEALDKAAPGQPQRSQILRLIHADGRMISVVLHVTVPRDQPDLRRLTIGWQHSLETGTQSGDLLEQLLDDGDEMISVLTPQGQLLYANQAWAKGHGLSKQEVEGRDRMDLMALHDAVRDERLDRRVLSDGVSLSLTETRAPADGRGDVLHYTTRKFALRDGLGHLIGVASRSRDVTTETTDADRLRLNAMVVEHSLDAIVVMDQAMRILNVNPAFQTIMGFGLNRILGKTLASLQSAEQGGRARREMLADLQEHGHWQGELINRKSTGEEVTVWCSASRLTDDAGVLIGYVAIQSDLTRLRQIQAENERLAQFDTLTGLPNRLRMFDRLEDVLQSAQKRGSHFALIFLDLDAFKSVNDTLGHAVGDALLIQIAHRIQAAIRSNDMAARIGGDEFVVILPGLGTEAAGKVALRLLADLEQPFDLPGLPGYRPSASIGLAHYPDHGQTAAELLRNADTAMYAAKAERGRLAVYRPSMGAEAALMLDLRNALLGAIERRELVLYYQPLFNIADQSVIGAEALLRWARPGHDLVLPGQFLPIAKSAGLMPIIDAWVMNDAIATLGIWQDKGLLPPGWVLSVNQTVDHLNSPDWRHLLADLMTKAGLLPHTSRSVLQIELTEGQVAGPMDTVLQNLHELKSLGVRLAVDDFGTGYSNLSYLRTLPISTLKIDAAFVRGIESDANLRVLVDAMLSLGDKLGYQVLAEGIETPAQNAILMQMGCQMGQGYLISPALPEADFVTRFLGPAANWAPAPKGRSRARMGQKAAVLD